MNECGLPEAYCVCNLSIAAYSHESLAQRHVVLHEIPIVSGIRFYTVNSFPIFISFSQKFPQHPRFSHPSTLSSVSPFVEASPPFSSKPLDTWRISPISSEIPGSHDTSGGAVSTFGFPSNRSTGTRTRSCASPSRRIPPDSCPASRGVFALWGGTHRNPPLAAIYQKCSERLLRVVLLLLLRTQGVRAESLSGLRMPSNLK